MRYHILILLVWTALCAAFDPNSYENTQEIIPGKYDLYWTVDLPNDRINIAMKAFTTGFVGFGIAEPTSGSMPGSDVVVGYVINGVGSIEDRYTVAEVMPILDDCQNWNLTSAEETSDGWTIIEVSRFLEATDPQDRSIVEGTNRIIVSFGGSDVLQYHGPNNRTTSAITFWGQEVLFDTTLPDDVETITLTMNNFIVPSGDVGNSPGTEYACGAFVLPMDQDYWIVRVDPIVDPRNEATVHHYLLHQCYNTSATSYVNTYQQPGTCQSPVGNQDSGCTGLIAAWAAGGGPTYVPPEAGFPMGPKPQSAQQIILEIHYNNVGGQNNYPDNSGVKIYYTKTPRQYDAGMITLGDPFVSFASILPGTSPEYQAECPTQCTNNLETDLNVFGSFLHMHQIGTEIWTSQWRKNSAGVFEDIGDIGRIEFWSFGHQMTQPINKTIKAGDHLNTHCVYKNDGNQPIPFGEASTQEMCMHFLSYYPRQLIGDQQYQFCGAYNTGQTTVSICGAETVIQQSNPIHPDPPGGRNITFGVDPTFCQLVPGPTGAPTDSPTSAPGTPAPSSTPKGSTSVHVNAAGLLSVSTMCLFVAAIFAL